MKIFRIDPIRMIVTSLISFVFVINIQAGLDFFLHPISYSSAFELVGLPGEVAVAGTGLLFIMWNIPYVFALWNPVKNYSALIQANLMQFTGCVGETIILFRFTQEQHPVLFTSIRRFIIFDTIGLVLLIIAGFLVLRKLRISN